MDWVVFLGIIFALYFFALWWRRWRHIWREATPHYQPLIFVQPHMAVNATILGHVLPEGYRLASLFFGTGLIDRTRTLDHGFPYKVLDPIPKPEPNVPDISALCDQRAEELVGIARKENLPVRLLWSGGIDSTAACVALLNALEDEPDRLEIVYSAASQREYAWFYRHVVRKHPRKLYIRNLSDALRPDAIITTGEHGDQLFGSMKAIGITGRTFRKFWRDRTDRLFLPWEEEFPRVLNEQLASSGRADAVLNYLRPQFAACPIPLNTLFDLLWWMNFSLKWQPVSLRLASFMPQEQFMPVLSRTHHFFRSRDFQLWSLANPDKRIGEDWKSYKWPLKAFIRDFNGDERYYLMKEKRPSMRGMVRRKSSGLALAIDADLRYFWQSRDKSLRSKLEVDSATAIGGGGLAISYSSFREASLWDDLGDGE